MEYHPRKEPLKGAKENRIGRASFLCKLAEKIGFMELHKWREIGIGAEIFHYDPKILSEKMYYRCDGCGLWKTDNPREENYITFPLNALAKKQDQAHLIIAAIRAGAPGLREPPDFGHETFL